MGLCCLLYYPLLHAAWNGRLRPRPYLALREMRAKAPSFLANIARIAKATNASNVTKATNVTNGTNVSKVTPLSAWNSSSTVKTPLPQRRFNFQRLSRIFLGSKRCQKSKSTRKLDGKTSLICIDASGCQVSSASHWWYLVLQNRVGEPKTARTSGIWSGHATKLAKVAVICENKLLTKPHMTT